MVVAAFDLDDCLLDGDSDRAWRVFLVEQGLLDAQLEKVRSAEFLAAYERGVLDAQACSRFSVEPLVGMAPAALTDLQQQFAARHLKPMIRPPALALLDKHRRQGHHMVIVTSTSRFVAECATRLLAVEQLLATELQWHDGRLTGALDGPPCYREGKKVHLRRWAKQQGHSLEGAFFYSDSSNDRPLLEAVDNPVAVNPDPQLKAHAKRLGWPILQLR